jgi:hypothetical protein
MPMCNIMLKLLGGCIVAGVVFAPATGASGVSGNPKSAEDASGLFNGKYLVVFFKSPRINSASIMGNVQLKQLGRTSYIKGRIHDYPGSPSAWTKAVVWVPVEEVLLCFEFETFEDAREACAKLIRQQEQRPIPPPPATTPGGPIFERTYPSSR